MTVSSDKKEELKKLFYSSLSEIELKKKLNVSHKEYRELLTIVKSELGLKSSYRRRPHRFGLYVKDSYFIMKINKSDNEDFEIIEYYPTYESAEYTLKNIQEDNKYNTIIGQATDDNMKDLIKLLYFQKKCNWEEIIQKCKLPYHKFYELLNSLKKDMNKEGYKTINENRYIYKYAPTDKFVVRKYIDGKYKTFGYHDNFEDAKKMRDYLESIKWDIKVYEENFN